MTSSKRTYPWLAVTAAVGCLMIPAPAAAETVTVRESSALQRAIDRAAPGDEIVLKGRLRATVTVFGKTDLRITGPRRAKLQGEVIGEPVIAVRDSSDITIERFTLDAYGGDAIHIADSSDVRIEKMKIGSSTAPARFDSRPVGVRVENSDTVRVKRSKFRGQLNRGVLLGASADSPATLSVVTRSNFRLNGGVGVEVNGSQNVVVRNTMVRGRTAVLVNGSSDFDPNIVRRNRIKRPVGYGVLVESGASVVAENQMTLPVIDGILVDGPAHVVTANKVKRSCHDGIVVSGSKTIVLSNSVVRPTDAGIAVEGDTNVIQNNDVRGAGEADILIAGDENLVTNNNAEIVLDDGVDVATDAENL